jgi:fumarate hydratase, class I
MDLASMFAENFAPARTDLRLLSREGLRVTEFGGKAVLQVQPGVLPQLAEEAFHDINFLFRTAHLEQWAGILKDAQSSANDRFAAAALLKNAAISAEGILPACQDTGTATVMAFKGEQVWTGGDDAAQLETGIRKAYAENYFRFSQIAPLSMFEEKNTKSNLPAQIDIYAAAGAEYQFLFVAKGGGSSNKTAFFSETKALLNESSLTAFLKEKVQALGVAACPPYHLALVVGGTSPEFNLKLLKLASAGALDYLPEQAGGSGIPYRDRQWEGKLCEIAVQTKLGAQFGGKYLALDARVIRCARHGAGCPVSLGVSCSAHRNILGRISARGVFLEALDRDPARYLSAALPVIEEAIGKEAAPSINLDQGIEEVCAKLSRCPVGALVSLSGTMIIARDAAHARFNQLLKDGRPLPEYLKRHPVYYAGPANTPPGRVIGSLGPTTAQRMDSYLAAFMAQGASLVTLAKGQRTPAAVEACRTYGGFYLGTIGGAASLQAQENIARCEIIDYADLGMEAVHRVEVRSLPAFIVLDNKGNNFFQR